MTNRSNWAATIDGAGDIGPHTFAGRNFHFGVREHAMGAIAVGMALLRRGLFGFFSSFVPHGAPLLLLPLLVPIEVVSLLIRAFALMIRLFANMTAGHQIILVLLTGELVGVTYLLHQGFFMKLLVPAPLIGVIVMDAFEIFVAFIQAFIFALLTALYLGEVLEESH